MSVLLWLYIFFFLLVEIIRGTELVGIGVILDSSDKLGNISRSYMEMARSDFYKAHPNYTTRLRFHFRDPKDDVVDAATAALDLMENEEVEAIIGPEWSTQAKFVIELGRKAQVPIIAYSATSPSLSPTQNPYFVRTAYDDSSQVKAIAAIIQAFGWREVSIIYEDTEYGNGLLSYLTDSFQDVDIRIPHKSAITPSSLTLELDILKTLNTLLRMQTRVFLVHMTGPLGYRFFSEAHKAQMLNEDFAWIVTNGLSSFVDPAIEGAAFAMEGVVGVRPYISNASKLEFNNQMEANPNLNGTLEFNLFGLWAYDTVTALATVVEKAWSSRPSESEKVPVTPNNPNFTTTKMSKIGNKILQGMRNLKIDNGFSGDFHLVNGQLQSSAFDVFNVVGNKEQVIGFWTSKHGLSKDISVKGRDYSTSKEDLQTPIWPGRSRNIPKGWVIPVKGEKHMKIGVPLRSGFQEFFRIEWDQYTNEPKYSGFSNDVFLAVWGKLPFALPYKFVPFMNHSRQSNGTFSEMLYQISQKKVDAVVADATITSNRSEYVDFTLPYSESGVRMLVAIKDNYRHDKWIFLKPFCWDLWVTSALAFIANGLVVWFLERHNNEDFRGSWHQKLELSIWFSFSTLVFAQRERVVSNWTRLVVVVWVFMVLIITQSYAANLASFLTVQQLQPKYMNVEEIKSKGYPVGYQKNAFVKDDILVKLLGFSNNDSLLIPYESVEQFHEALSNGKVAAIFDEIPYIRLFLAMYCDKFMMVGPTYKSDGFGFAFPINSPLVPYFSRAILAVTEDKKTMDEIENRNNLSQSLCKEQSENDGATFMDSDNTSLSLYSFSGLFIIVGAVSLFALCGELISLKRHMLLSTLKYGYYRFTTFWSDMVGKWRGELEATRSTNHRVNPVLNIEGSPSRDSPDDTLSTNVTSQVRATTITSPI